MTTVFDLTEYVNVLVHYQIVKEEQPPRGPEEVGREQVLDVVSVDSIDDLQFNPDFIGPEVMLDIDFGNKDYRKRILQYVEKEMNSDIDKYLS